MSVSVTGLYRGKSNTGHGIYITEDNKIKDLNLTILDCYYREYNFSDPYAEYRQSKNIFISDDAISTVRMFYNSNCNDKDIYIGNNVTNMVYMFGQVTNVCNVYINSTKFTNICGMFQTTRLSNANVYFPNKLSIDSPCNMYYLFLTNRINAYMPFNIPEESNLYGMIGQASPSSYHNIRVYTTEKSASMILNATQVLNTFLTESNDICRYNSTKNIYLYNNM